MIVTPRSSRLPRLIPLLALLGVYAVGSCHRDGVSPDATHPALTAADVTRARLLGRVVIPSLDRTVATVDDLHARGVLPFSGADLRTMLLTRLSLPEGVVDLVDTGRPLALAFLAPVTPAVGTISAPAPTVTGAFFLRGGSAIASVLGSPLTTIKQAQEIRARDGRSYWMLPVGDAVIWADSFEALADGGVHALAARTESPEDLILTAYPPAYGRAQGFDPSAGFAPWKQRLLGFYEEHQRSRGRRVPAAERASLEALLDYALVPIAESTSIETTVGLGRERGVQATVRAQPQPGSPWAKSLLDRAPAQVHPPLLDPAGMAMVGGLGVAPTLLKLVQQTLDGQAQAGVPGAAAVAARLRPLLGLITGAMSSALRVNGRALGSEAAFELAPGTGGSAALDTLAALLSDPALPVLLRQTTPGEPPTFKIQRDARGVRAEVAFPDDARAGTPGALVRAASGSSTLTLTATTSGNQLLFATEPGASARLAALVAGTAAAAPQDTLATALGEIHGRAAFVYLDAWTLARPLVPALVGGAEGRMIGGLLAIPGFANLSLPIWASVDDGAQLTAELRVPLSTIANAASALALFGGASSGP